MVRSGRFRRAHEERSAHEDPLVRTSLSHSVQHPPPTWTPVRVWYGSGRLLGVGQSPRSAWMLGSKRLVRVCDRGGFMIYAGSRRPGCTSWASSPMLSRPFSTTSQATGAVWPGSIITPHTDRRSGMGLSDGPGTSSVLCARSVLCGRRELQDRYAVRLSRWCVRRQESEGGKRQVMVDTDGRALDPEAAPANGEDRDGAPTFFACPAPVPVHYEGVRGHGLYRRRTGERDLHHHRDRQVGSNRRLWKDPEATLASARAFLYAASVMLLVRQLGRPS